MTHVRAPIVAGGDRIRWRDIGFLALILVLLFGAFLGSRAIWTPDEGRYVEIAREMLATGDYVTPRLNGVKYFEKPAFFYWLTAGAIKAFGLNEWAARVWPALFAVLGCMIVYVATCRLYGRRAAWLAVAVLATSPLYYLLGRTVTLDIAVSVLLTCGLLLFLLGMREPPGSVRRLHMWGFYACAALATLTKGLIGIVIPGMVIGAWMLALNEWRMLRTMYLPSGILLFLIIAIPWHALVMRANPEFAYFYFIHEHLLRYTTTIHHRYEPVWFFIPVLLVGIYPWSAFLAQTVLRHLPQAWRDRRKHSEALFLLIWAAVVFVFFSLSDSKLIPYVLPVVPPLAILTGSYLSHVWRQDGSMAARRALWALLVLGVALTALLLYLPGHMQPHPKVAEYTSRLGDYIYLIAASLAAAATIPFVFSRLRRCRWTIVSLIGASAFIVTSISAALPQLDDKRSVKRLAQVLKPRLRAQDMVVTYHAYFQDAPVYLNRYVTVVGWTGELRFGAQVEPLPERIMDEATFWRRWRSTTTVYAIADKDDYPGLYLRSRGTAHILAKNDHNMLLVNHEPKP